MQDPAVLVSRAYELLLADEIASFLDLFTTDCTVDYPAAGSLPYGGEWRGRDGLQRFLDVHDETEEILEFDVSRVVSDGDHVFALGSFQGRSKSTGRTWETAFVHVFRVREGKIEQWRDFFDTSAAVQAHEATAAQAN